MINVKFTGKAQEESLFIPKIGTPPKGLEMQLNEKVAKGLEARGFLIIQKPKKKVSVRKEDK